MPVDVTRDEEPPVEAGVLGLHGPVALVVVGEHKHDPDVVGRPTLAEIRHGHFGVDQGRWRARTAAAWAGKPSCSASATTEGVMRARATASARATAVRLRNASTVIPDDTVANPLVGSAAGQPITKSRRENGVCCPTRISPASWRCATCRVAVGHDELQVFGRVRVGHGERGFQIVDDDRAPIYAERGSEA